MGGGDGAAVAEEVVGVGNEVAELGAELGLDVGVGGVFFELFGWDEVVAVAEVSEGREEGARDLVCNPRGIELGACDEA